MEEIQTSSRNRVSAEQWNTTRCRNLFKYHLLLKGQIARRTILIKEQFKQITPSSSSGMTLSSSCNKKPMTIVYFFVSTTRSKTSRGSKITRRSFQSTISTAQRSSRLFPVDSWRSSAATLSTESSVDSRVTTCSRSGTRNPFWYGWWPQDSPARVPSTSASDVESLDVRAQRAVVGTQSSWMSTWPIVHDLASPGAVPRPTPRLTSLRESLGCRGIEVASTSMKGRSTSARDPSRDRPPPSKF